MCIYGISILRHLFDRFRESINIFLQDKSVMEGKIMLGKSMLGIRYSPSV